MSFIHEDREFTDLVRIVAQARDIVPTFVEKDYWVVHTLWSLAHAGLDIWFKGGTSLSKGFGLIERFSEDLDLKVEPGRVAGLPSVSNWTGTGGPAVRARAAYFDALVPAIAVPGAEVVRDPDDLDALRRGVRVQVRYPVHNPHAVTGLLRPFVLLEIGNARVTPSVACDLTSFIHDHLAELGQLEAFEDNQPRGVRCVHPLVTLIEKLDALRKRVPRKELAPASFVRHFEDAARIIAAEERLPPLSDGWSAQVLASEMLEQRQIGGAILADDPAFATWEGAREADIQAAYTAIGPMFWGERMTLNGARERIRAWIERRLPADWD